MTRLVGLLWRTSRGAFLLALAAGVVGGAGGVALIALIPAALRAEPGGRDRLGLVFAAVCLGTVLARVVAQVAMIRIAQDSVAGLVRHLCAKILDLPLRRFESHQPGRLLAVLTEDVMVLTTALAGLPLLFINLTVVVGCLAYLGVVSRAVFVSNIVFIGPAVASHLAFAGRGQRRLGRALAEQDVLAGHFRELVEGFKELQLHRDRREAFLRQSVGAAAARARDESTAGLSLFAAIQGWGQFLYFGYLGFLIFGLPLIVDLPAGAVATAALTVLYVISPLDALLSKAPVLARAAASLARVEALGLTLEAEAPRPSPSAAAPPAPPPTRLDAPIVVRDLCFHYPAADLGGEGFTLGPLDLTVYPGELLFLVGGNGSGKTTLLKLLTGLYPASSGSIEWGGREVDRAVADEYRALFTVVFAGGFVFPSLLGLGGPDLDRRARRMLTDLGLDGVVRVEGGVFSTTSLSQGQRGRLALLAACLEERPVLVLDEWASYQDPAFKRAFYRRILPDLKARGATVVVISHDDDYFDAADRVVHLASGMVATPAPEFAAVDLMA